MAAREDYYNLLGVKRGASDEKSRRLTVVWHASITRCKSGDKVAEEKFKQISEAYIVLSDPRKKFATVWLVQRKSARCGEQKRKGRAFPAASWVQIGRLRPTGGGATGSGPSIKDIFGDLFSGGGAGTPTQSNNAARTMVISLSFERRYRGTTKTISTCGATIFARAVTAPAKVQVRRSRMTCQGSGKVIWAEWFPQPISRAPIAKAPANGVRPVMNVLGAAALAKAETVTIRIPAGVGTARACATSSQARAGGQKRRGNRRFIHHHKRFAHPVFTRKGDNIECIIPITLTGGAWPQRLKCQPSKRRKHSFAFRLAHQSGQRFRLREKGAPSF
ncbi:MAG: DnaJ C-terminal domain-containing protein [Blastocatellia bacterium]